MTQKGVRILRMTLKNTFCMKTNLLFSYDTGLPTKDETAKLLFKYDDLNVKLRLLYRQRSITRQGEKACAACAEFLWASMLKGYSDRNPHKS